LILCVLGGNIRSGIAKKFTVRFQYFDQLHTVSTIMQVTVVKLDLA